MIIDEILPSGIALSGHYWRVYCRKDDCDVAAACVGSMTALARETQLPREGLYQSFSPDGNPGLDTLVKVLHAAEPRASA